MSPTQRSLAYIRSQGMKPWIVEYWNPFARKRVDLYGCIDILCIGNGETWAVQTTSTGVASRVKKITESEYFPVMLESGWRVFVHGWAKNTKGEMKHRVVELTSENLLTSIGDVGSDDPA
jgi:hypothetical protein